MHIFFGDDSVRQGRRGRYMGKIVSFGGVLLKSESLQPLQARLREVRDQFGVPQDEEVKWSPPRSSWIFKNLHGEERTQFYVAFLKAARDNAATAFVVCIDTGRVRYSNEEALRKGIDWSFERISMCLEDKHSLGLIVCDRPGGGKREEDTLLAQVLGTIQRGTEYVPPGRIALNILTTPSHLVQELQLADLVTGVTTSMIAGEVRYAEPVFEEVRPMLHKNNLGYAGGAGLKLYPNELLNLHYWVGKEGAFVKASRMNGYGLPWRNWAYAKDGFDDARESPLVVSAYP